MRKTRATMQTNQNMSCYLRGNGLKKGTLHKIIISFDKFNLCRNEYFDRCSSFVELVRRVLYHFYQRAETGKYLTTFKCLPFWEESFKDT